MSEFPPGEITPGSSSIEEGRHPISHEPEALRRDIGPQTPDRLGLLELERPLDPESFPDPPRSGSATVPTTIPNVAHLLTAYIIRVNYDLIKKRLVVRLPTGAVLRKWRLCPPVRRRQDLQGRRLHSLQRHQSLPERLLRYLDE